MLRGRLPISSKPHDSWLYPEPETGREQGGVYGEDVTFRLRLRLAVDLPLGELELPCVVSHEACDANKWRRPAPVELRSSLPA